MSRILKRLKTNSNSPYAFEPKQLTKTTTMSFAKYSVTLPHLRGTLTSPPIIGYSGHLAKWVVVSQYPLLQNAQEKVPCIIRHHCLTQDCCCAQLGRESYGPWSSVTEPGGQRMSRALTNCTTRSNLSKISVLCTTRRQLVHVPSANPSAGSTYIEASPTGPPTLGLSRLKWVYLSMKDKGRTRRISSRPQIWPSPNCVEIRLCIG